MFCVDCRTLNGRMRPYGWTFPKIEEIFDELPGNKIFTTLDLFSGYWKIRVADKFKEGYWKIRVYDKFKEITTFLCRLRTFKFEVMPFELMNAPSTFQRMMDVIFRKLPFVRVYIYDVVLFSLSTQKLEEYLRKVIDCISGQRLKVKISKCDFGRPQLRLLGQIIDSKGSQ